MKTLIIIPAYNVENEIKPLLNGLMEYKNNVVFIVDGSTDNTLELIKSYKYSVINNKYNIGVSKSILKGLEYAKMKLYDSVVLMDADGQHDPKYLPDFISCLANADFVFGNRFSTNQAIPTIKLCSNLLAAMFVNKIYDSHFLDVSCGFKGFRLSNVIIDRFKNSSGYEIVFDLFFYALSSNKRIELVNIDAVYDNSKFLSTRKEELMAFLNAIKRNNLYAYISFKLDELHEKIYNNKDFVCIINDITFYGFFISCKSTYIIQSDPQGLFLYLKEKECLNSDKRV